MESRDVASQPIDPLILALSFLGNRNSARKRSVLEKLEDGEKVGESRRKHWARSKTTEDIIEIVEERGNRGKYGVWHFGPRNIRGRK